MRDVEIYAQPRWVLRTAACPCGPILFSAPSYSHKQTITKTRWLWGQKLQIGVTYSVDQIDRFLDNLCYRKEEVEKSGEDGKDDTVKDEEQSELCKLIVPGWGK